MTASIDVRWTPELQYLLRIGDTALILAQRLGEWCGHAPALEEDIAMANMALDLVGQARALLTHAGRIEGRGRDEDQLAFLRDERDYRNLTMAELPRGDFAFTVVRNTMLAGWFEALWTRLQASTDAEVVAIAAKAVKEARYHHRHAADWLVRLGDGTAESRRRTEAALAELWRYVPELFEPDEVDAAARASGLGPAWDELHADWHAAMLAVLDEATLAPPADGKFRSTGKRGVHGEHMGYLLAEMQQLQRSFPEAVW